MNRRDQSDVVAADIEYRKFTYLIGRWEGLSKFGEGAEVRCFDQVIPPR
jgi:hypothetical protein